MVTREEEQEMEAGLRGRRWIRWIKPTNVQSRARLELEHIPNLQAHHQVSYKTSSSHQRGGWDQSQTTWTHPEKSTAKGLHQTNTKPMPTTQLLRQAAETPGPSLGGGILRLDISPRETYNIGRTHWGTHTKYKSDTCQTKKWRSIPHQQQSRARSIDAQNYPNTPNNPRT
jgi:hypothetical protein